MSKEREVRCLILSSLQEKTEREREEKIRRRSQSHSPVFLFAFIPLITPNRQKWTQDTERRSSCAASRYFIHSL